MSNYINTNSLIGLMNQRGIICDKYPLSFYKVKNKSKIVVCGERLSEEDEQKYKQVNYMYLNEDPKVKGAYKMTQVVSKIDPIEMFQTLPGKKYREIRETVNKFKKIVKVESLCSENAPDVINMINEWENSEKGGRKYMWQSHPGIDKNVVEKLINGKLSDCFGLVFYIDNKCVGYSCCECSYMMDDNREIKYLTRKTLNNYRNLTLYVDWYTFYYLNLLINDNKSFKINWGCSSGGVLNYKMKKWPIYSLEYKWFLTIKNN